MHHHKHFAALENDYHDDEDDDDDDDDDYDDDGDEVDDVHHYLHGYGYHENRDMNAEDAALHARQMDDISLHHYLHDRAALAARLVHQRFDDQVLHDYNLDLLNTRAMASKLADYHNDMNHELLFKLEQLSHRYPFHESRRENEGIGPSISNLPMHYNSLLNSRAMGSKLTDYHNDMDHELMFKLGQLSHRYPFHESRREEEGIGPNLSNLPIHNHPTVIDSDIPYGDILHQHLGDFGELGRLNEHLRSEELLRRAEFHNPVDAQPMKSILPDVEGHSSTHNFIHHPDWNIHQAVEDPIAAVDHASYSLSPLAGQISRASTQATAEHLYQKFADMDDHLIKLASSKKFIPLMQKEATANKIENLQKTSDIKNAAAAARSMLEPTKKTSIHHDEIMKHKEKQMNPTLKLKKEENTKKTTISMKQSEKNKTVDASQRDTIINNPEKKRDAASFVRTLHKLDHIIEMLMSSAKQRNKVNNPETRDLSAKNLKSNIISVSRNKKERVNKTDGNKDQLKNSTGKVESKKSETNGNHATTKAKDDSTKHPTDSAANGAKKAKTTTIKTNEDIKRKYAKYKELLKRLKMQTHSVTTLVPEDESNYGSTRYNNLLKYTKGPGKEKEMLLGPSSAFEKVPNPNPVPSKLDNLNLPKSNSSTQSQHVKMDNSIKSESSQETNPEQVGDSLHTISNPNTQSSSENQNDDMKNSSISQISQETEKNSEQGQDTSNKISSPNPQPSLEDNLDLPDMNVNKTSRNETSDMTDLDTLHNNPENSTSTHSAPIAIKESNDDEDDDNDITNNNENKEASQTQNEEENEEYLKKKQKNYEKLRIKAREESQSANVIIPDGVKMIQNLSKSYNDRTNETSKSDSNTTYATTKSTLLKSPQIVEEFHDYDVASGGDVDVVEETEANYSTNNTNAPENMMNKSTENDENEEDLPKNSVDGGEINGYNSTSRNISQSTMSTDEDDQDNQDEEDSPNDSMDAAVEGYNSTSRNISQSTMSTDEDDQDDQGEEDLPKNSVVSVEEGYNSTSRKISDSDKGEEDLPEDSNETQNDDDKVDKKDSSDDIIVPEENTDADEDKSENDRAHMDPDDIIELNKEEEEEDSKNNTNVTKAESQGVLKFHSEDDGDEEDDSDEDPNDTSEDVESQIVTNKDMLLQKHSLIQQKIKSFRDIFGRKTGINKNILKPSKKKSINAILRDKINSFKKFHLPRPAQKKTRSISENIRTAWMW